MRVEILKDGIKPPAQNNLMWIFPVRLEGRGPLEWRVDSFDLSVWFREAMGRYPRREEGDGGEKQDILENWSRVEPRLRREAEREAQLGTTLAVHGTRITAAELDAVRDVPAEELPPLSEPQRNAARKMKISEEAYARNLLAQQWSLRALLAKTERLSRLLKERLKQFAPGATVERVMLNTADCKFYVDIIDQNEPVPLRIREEVVDDLFEGGSVEAENRIVKIVETAVKYHHGATQ